MNFFILCKNPWLWQMFFNQCMNVFSEWSRNFWRALASFIIMTIISPFVSDSIPLFFTLVFIKSICISSIYSFLCFGQFWWLASDSLFFYLFTACSSSSRSAQAIEVFYFWFLLRSSSSLRLQIHQINVHLYRNIYFFHKFSPLVCVLLFFLVFTVWINRQQLAPISLCIFSILILYL